MCSEETGEGTRGSREEKRESKMRKAREIKIKAQMVRNEKRN